MDVFLGLPSFAGPSIDVRAAGATFVGQATFNGHIAVSNWRRDEVERLLAPDLELAANCSAPALHPVAFAFGEQSEGGVIFGGLSVPMNVRYHEFAMAIPFVRHRRGRYLHTFVARMYAGYFPATWNGNVHYGLAKQTAELSWQEPIFTVTTANGLLLLHAAVEPAGDWVAGPDPALANFAAMQSAFALPIVGHKADGTYVCSYFGWDFAEASVRPVRCALSIDDALIRNLQPQRCYAVHDGAFEVRAMRWRLSWPVPCRF